MSASAGTKRHDQASAVSMFDGLGERRTLAIGDRMLLAEFRFKKGGVVPLHVHDFEQVGYCVSGVLDYSLDGVVHRVTAGGGYSVPAGVKHGGTAVEETVVVEIFSPPRDDYR